MVKAVQAALDSQGIDDKIEVVGQFEPRGTTGAIFAGGMIGGEVGGAFGGVADAVGTGAGMLGGIEAASQVQGLPRQMLVGASQSTVYGFKMRGMEGRKTEPHELVFRVPRADLEVKVHQRVNVRTLELIDRDSGSKIELEGGRIPITHSHALIKFLES